MVGPQADGVVSVVKVRLHALGEHFLVIRDAILWQAVDREPPAVWRQIPLAPIENIDLRPHVTKRAFMLPGPFGDDDEVDLRRGRDDGLRKSVFLAHILPRLLADPLFLDCAPGKMPGAAVAYTLWSLEQQRLGGPHNLPLQDDEFPCAARQDAGLRVERFWTEHTADEMTDSFGPLFVAPLGDSF